MMLIIHVSLSGLVVLSLCIGYKVPRRFFRSFKRWIRSMMVLIIAWAGFAGWMTAYVMFRTVPWPVLCFIPAGLGFALVLAGSVISRARRLHMSGGVLYEAHRP